MPEPLVSLLSLLLAAAISAGITHVSRPLLQRYALARPNARSSHRIPTPQGAGIAVIAATLLVAGAIMLGTGATTFNIPIAVLPRLLLQGAAVAAIIFTAPDGVRIVPAVPLPIERGLLLLAGLWFVN